MSEPIILIILLELPVLVLCLYDISAYIHNRNNRSHWTFYNMGQEIKQQGEK